MPGRDGTSSLVVREMDGVFWYASPLLEAAGVPHAFSTRLGGVSGGPFASLNLGNPNGCPVQDRPESIGENYRRLERAAGLAGRRRLQVHQVHGCAVAHAPATKGDSPVPGSAAVEEHGFDVHQRADAIVTARPGSYASVRTADCCPVLLASGAGQMVAAVHAGWRGIVAGVIEATVAGMEADPEDLLAAVGPCIGVEAFEVGAEVIEAFGERFGQEAPVRHEAGKGRVDLPGAAVLALRRAGVPVEQTDVGRLCTFQRAEEFFSHRRDRGITGRMANVIGPRGS